MDFYTSWSGLPRHAQGGSVALGNFDGVHRGHAHLLRSAHAGRPDAMLAVLTFEPHPRELFRPDDPPFRLSLPAERRAALAAMGVRTLFELPFDTEFSALSAEDFIRFVLHEGIGAAHLTCGPDFAFGHRRGGDAGLLAARAEALGIGISIVPPLLDSGAPVSSSRIRRLLQDGYPERAALELGRLWSLRGVVTPGDQRGRTIGFPTANIPLGRQLEPARGVYAITARLAGGDIVTGVANIGVRPTVNGAESRLEAHLFDWRGDLYGQEIVITLHHFLRAERKFNDFSALRDQIKADAKVAREILKIITFQDLQ